MAMAKFQEGTVTVKYTDWQIKTNSDGTVVADKDKEKIVKTLVFNLTGNRVNFFDNTYNSTFTDALATTNAEKGDERLYVKGGAGSMAVIDIDNEALNALKADKNLLINEANLVFNVDDSQDGMGKTVNGSKAIEPFRVYLYDLKNNQPIFDYYADATSSTSFPKYNKAIHGGILALDATTKRGTQYKIRLTNYISRVVRGDSTNVKLGLVVTENINVISSGLIKEPFSEGDIQVKRTPSSSAVHPFGTVLHGSNSADEKKRLKLEIYYTKPN